MSGGSYDYLWADELNAMQLERMADRLDFLGYPRLATRTRGYLPPDGDHPIRMVWKAVEWMDSGDTTEAVCRASLEGLIPRLVVTSDE